MRIATLSYRQIILGSIFVAIQITAAAAQAPVPTPAAVDPYIHRSNFVVADLDRSMRLYRDIFGLKLDVMVPVTSDSFMYDVFHIDHAAKMRIAFLSAPDHRFGAIGMTEVKGVKLPGVPASFPSVLILEIKGRIESVYEKVKAEKLDAGKLYELTGPSRREFPVTDYDGNRIIVMQLHASD